MNFDVETVVKQMLAAAVIPLKKYWKTAEPVAKSEFTKIAELVEQIGVDRLKQTITPADAADLLQEAKLAAETAIDAQIGLATVAAEDAINAALGAVSSTINGYLGFLLV